MELNIEQKEGLVREAVFILSNEELQPHFQKALESVQAEAQIDGFRKGKVPMNIVKAKFGKAIENEALQDIADERFRSAMKEREEPVAGVPILREATRTDDKGARFLVEYEVYPEIVLREYHEIELEKPVREISEEDIDNEINNILLRHSSTVPAESVIDTRHVVKLKFSDIDSQTGMPLLGGKEHEYFLDHEELDPILRNDCLNTKVGDSFRYTVEHAAGEHGEHAHQHHYLVTVNEIQKVVLPELTQEFIESISGNMLHTVEELRVDMRKSLAMHWDRELQSSMREQLIARMIGAHSFEVPKSLVALAASDMIQDAKKKHPDDKYLKRAKEQELFEAFLPGAEETIRWQLLIEAVIKKEDIKLSDEDLDDTAARLRVDREQLRVAMESNEQIRNQMLIDRLYDFLFRSVTVIERPYDEMVTEYEEQEERQ